MSRCGDAWSRRLTTGFDSDRWRGYVQWETCPRPHVRESPAVEIALHLAQEGIGRVLAVEPHVDTLPQPMAEAGIQLRGADEALAEADIVLGLVAHRGFQKVSRQVLLEKIVIDTCGLWR